MALRAISLCSGIGAIDKALAGISRTICYVEREAYAAAVLVSRMRDGSLDTAPIWSDVETFDGGPWRGLVDLIHAGFPCQPVSHAGARKGESDERWIWPDILRVVAQVEPPYVFLENVPGLISLGLGTVLGDLATLGYDAEWGVLSACASGAPHTRERVFILAYSPSIVSRQGVGQEFQTSGGQSVRYEWGEHNERIERYFRIRKEFASEGDRVVNGSASWVDRVFILGNSAVPNQVKQAWDILYGRIYGT